jgi:hypothetical protein
VRHHLAQNFWWQCHDVSAYLARLYDVQRVPHTCHEHIGVKLVVLENLHYFPNDGHALLARVIQPANERAHVGRAGLGR